MSNLLDRASVVLTPTAYNNGEALCIKPDDGSGDFTFSRNSAATRVNAQGLVENVQILSSNLVQNGDFSEEGSEEVSNGSFSQEGSELVTNGDFANWTNDNPDDYLVLNENANNYVTESNGQLRMVSDNSATIAIRPEPTNMLTTGKIYKVSVDLIFTSGTIDISGTSFNTSGTKVFYLTAPTSYLQIAKASALDVLIDNVSVREVGQDWGFGTGWSIAEDKAVCDGSVVGNSFLISTGNTLTIGKTYKVQYTILDYIQGNIRVRAGDATSIFVNADGSYTEYMVATNTETCRIQARNNFIGSITNISVKEVGQNWDLGSGWSIGEDKAVGNLTGNTALTQSNILTVGKIYKIEYTISDYVSGNFKMLNIPTSSYENSNGTYTVYGETDSVNLVALGVSFIGSITNISVIEITDDTNLPRINYEGFSYQDALGSELVVNGGFDTDSDWSKSTGWTIANGKANSNTSAYRTLAQNIPIVLGKKYKVFYDVVSYTSGSVSMTIGADSGALRSAVGSYSEIIEYNTFYSSSGPRSGGSGFVGSIDNVSVKEYLGQEVVPESGCGSWLFEPQSTNLITQSETFSDASWTKQQITITQNATISPSGLIDASMISEDNTNNYHRIRKNISLSVDATLSIFAKKGTIDKFLLWSGSNGVGFDLTLGTINNVSGLNPPSSSSIKDFGNGWYRCSITDNSISAFEVFSLQDFSGFIYQGSSTNNFYIWGAQLEEQSYATSYIPTSGSSVTRNQDVCTNGGSLASINSTEGTLYFEGASLESTLLSGYNYYITISDGTSSNRLELRQTTSNMQFLWRVNGVYQNQIVSSGILLTDFNKIALKYSNSQIALWMNGSQIGTINSPTLFPINTLNDLSFNDGTLGFPFRGKTKALAVWKEALSDQELTELTTI